MGHMPYAFKRFAFSKLILHTNVVDLNCIGFREILDSKINFGFVVV